MSANGTQLINPPTPPKRLHQLPTMQPRLQAVPSRQHGSNDRHTAARATEKLGVVWPRVWIGIVRDFRLQKKGVWKHNVKANGTTLEPLDLNVTLKLDSSAIYWKRLKQISISIQSTAFSGTFFSPPLPWAQFFLLLWHSILVNRTYSGWLLVDEQRCRNAGGIEITAALVRLMLMNLLLCKLDWILLSFCVSEPLKKMGYLIMFEYVYIRICIFLAENFI